MSLVEHEVQAQFRRARRLAFFARLLAWVRGASDDLLPLDEVRSRIRIVGQHYRGLQTVPMQQIAGSEGRYHDFNRQFLPRHLGLKERWLSINRAHLTEVSLPPVELYQIDEIYFVKDGNHRVSVARLLGQEYVDALVTQLEVDVPLAPHMTLHDLLLKEEYSDFLEWTELARLRPDQQIEFSELGGYLALVGHINTHRYFMGLEQKRQIENEEAICDWYDTIYMPMVQEIREQNLLADFPKRTEADLYRWIMDHRWYLREQQGNDPGTHDAALDFRHRFKRGRGWLHLLRSPFQSLRQMLPLPLPA
jgi:hypothetical protein